ncbi:MAG: hypothetical protein C4542_05205 [Dehalococcoidia bacterium]|nr:MAG: hypothetical protein C4542_05205 [Dehalococcoidia bacterium]
MKKLYICGRKNKILLCFSDDGCINPKDAEKWARLIAREWGEINEQKKVKASGLPGLVWLFDCAGHGGYIMVASMFDVPETLHKYAVDGIAVWNKEWVKKYGEPYNGITVFRFEEDCNWAIFETTYPDVATWRVYNREKEWSKNPVLIDVDAGEESLLDPKRALLARERLASPDEMQRLTEERLESAKKTVARWCSEDAKIV